MAALLDRAAELDEVDGLLEGIERGSGGALVLEGPGGIGKTALVDWAVSLAAGRGIRVRRATGDDLEADHPWGMARWLFADLDPAALRGSAQLAEPVLAGDPAADLAGSHRELFPLLHGLHWLVVQLAEECPQLLVLDDAQWSDEQSLRFANYLLNRVDGLPVGVLIARRTGERPDPRIEGLLTRAGAGPATVVCRPGPLSATAVDALVRTDLPTATEAFCRAVAQATSGNPFLCKEILRSVRAEGIDPTDDAAVTLRNIDHAGIRTSILVRLAQLGPTCAAVASAAAVLGSAATVARLIALSGVDPARGGEAVDALVAADLLIDGPGLRFAHPIVREVIHADLGPARRSALHRDAARILDDDGADPAEVATHLQLAGRCGDDWAIAALRRAASVARAHGAPDRAVALLRTALASSPTDAEHREVLALLGRAEAAVGDPAAVDHLEAALDDHDDSGGVPALAFDLGRALYAAERFAEAVTAFDRGLDALGGLPAGDRDPVLEAQLVAGLEMAGLLCGVRPDRLERRLAAMQTPGAVLDPRAPDSVLLALAAGRHALGVGIPEAQRKVEAVRPLVDAALGWEPLFVEVGAVAIEPLALALLLTEQLDRGTRFLDRVVDATASRGEARAYTSVVVLRGLVHLARGDLGRAGADAADALRMAAHEAVPPLPHPAGRYVLARVALARGEVDEAARAVADERTGERAGSSVLEGWHHAAVGRVALAQERPADALAAFTRAGEQMRAAGGPGAYAPWRAGAALACAALGDHGRALEYADEELVLAEHFGAPGRIGAALRVRARLARDPDAVELLNDASARLAAGELALERALVDVDLGAALRRLGQRRDAREHLRRGLEGARACGARSLAARAASELEAAGARRPDLAVRGVESLTPSERRVADLAAQGRTNREIAAALFVSRKTVEVHLSATYRKLEISSRQELPHALA